MSTITCEDSELYEMRKENLRIFLDHLPTHPCCDRPNFNLCTVCFKINFDIARDCEVYKRFSEGIVADKSKETIHIELARSVDLGRSREDAEVPIPEQVEKEFPLFEFSTPTVKTSVFEVEEEPEIEITQPKKVKPKVMKKAKIKKVKPKKKKKELSAADRAYLELKRPYKKAGVARYDPEKHKAILKEADLAVWKATDDDNKVDGSPVIDMWSDFYDSLDGIEPQFYKFFRRFLGKGPSTTDGSPVFIYSEKWAGVVTISKLDGLVIFMDHGKSTLSDRMELLDLLNDTATALKVRAEGKGEDMSSKTKSKANWSSLIKDSTQRESSGDTVRELRAFGKPSPAPKKVIKKVKKVAKPPEERPEPPVAKPVPAEPKPEPGPPRSPDVIDDDMGTESQLDKKAPVKPERPKPSSVPPLFATLGKLETKKKNKQS